jgi:hypothetical protein
MSERNACEAACFDSAACPQRLRCVAVLLLAVQPLPLLENRVRCRRRCGNTSSSLRMRRLTSSADGSNVGVERRHARGMKAELRVFGLLQLIVLGLNDDVFGLNDGVFGLQQRILRLQHFVFESDFSLVLIILRLNNDVFRLNDAVFDPDLSLQLRNERFRLQQLFPSTRVRSIPSTASACASKYARRDSASSDTAAPASLSRRRCHGRPASASLSGCSPSSATAPPTPSSTFTTGRILLPGIAAAVV